MLPQVSFIVVNWNTKALVDKAIDSIYHFEKNIPLEIILVDNFSQDGSVAYLSKKYPNLKIIGNNANVGFARANNQGVTEALGKFVLLFNSDAYLTQEILPVCLKYAESLSPCLLGCKVLNSDGSPQISVDQFPSLGEYFREAFSTTNWATEKKISLQSFYKEATNPVDWISGAFLLVEKNQYISLGGLNEKIFMYGEDVEFCWRVAKAGIARYYIPSVSVVHLGGGSVNHASVRSIVLTDSGRIETFSLMKGTTHAFLLRCIFVTRSLLRGFAYHILAPFYRSKVMGQKGRNHFVEVLVLCGLRHRRNFI